MRLRIALAVLLVIGMATMALAESWPSRPIHWIVPYPPGGGTDVLARSIGAKLEKMLGQPVVIENKSGGSTITGTAALAAAAPDGYTFGMITDSLAINEALGVATPYDAGTDIMPVIKLADVPQMLIVNSNKVPQKSLKDLVTYSKSHPGWFTVGTLGPGSPHEIGIVWLKVLSQMDALIVPYRGVAPALQDLVAGQIKGMLIGVAVADEFIKAGTLHPIAVTPRTRVSSAPDIPTIAEQGYPDYDFSTFYGLAAPKGTPPEIIRKFNVAINEVIKEPEMHNKFAALGAELVGGSPAEFGVFLAANREKIKKIVSLAGLKK